MTSEEDAKFISFASLSMYQSSEELGDGSLICFFVFSGREGSVYRRNFRL